MPDAGSKSAVCRRVKLGRMKLDQERLRFMILGQATLEPPNRSDTREPGADATEEHERHRPRSPASASETDTRASLAGINPDQADILQSGFPISNADCLFRHRPSRCRRKGLPFHRPRVSSTGFHARRTRMAFMLFGSASFIIVPLAPRY